MEHRPTGFREVAVAGDTLQLSPGLAARMAISTDVAVSKSAVIGAIRLWTEVRRRVDNPSATSGEGDHRRGRTRRLRTSVGPLLTGRAERFVAEADEGFGFFGAFASGRIGLAGSVRGSPGIVGPPDMGDEADQHESDQ